MELKSLDLKSLFFIILLAALGLVMFRLFSPFLDIIIVALVLVQIFYPLYKSIHKRVKSNGVASILSTILTLVFVVIPIILIGLLAVFEINSLISNIPAPTEQVQGVSADAEGVGSAFSSIESQINDSLNTLNTSLAEAGIDLKQLLANSELIEETEADNVLKLDLGRLSSQVLTSIQSNIAPAVAGVISGGANVLFFGFLLIVTLIYMFNEYENLPQVFAKISPLDDELDELLYKKFTDTNRAVITGSFLVAIAQATAVSAVLMIMNIGAPVLLWLVMVILSLIPVGSGLVWVPISLALVAIGRPIEGILLLVYGAVAINVIDTYLRPRVMKNSVQLHPLIIIFSALGGITVFGPLGILYGPIAAVLFTSLMDVYAERYNKAPAKKTK